MHVCVRVPGSDPDRCLKIGIPDKQDREDLMAGSLPWCTPNISVPAQARAMCKTFAETGGFAVTMDDCSQCKRVENVRSLSTPWKLLELTASSGTARIASDMLLAKAGALDKVVEAPAGDEGDVLIARTWVAALRSAIAGSQDTVKHLQAKLRLADLLQWLTALISAASVTALFGIILSSESKTAQIVVGVIAVLAAWATTSADFLRKNVFGNSAVKQLEELVRAHADAEGVALELQLWADGPAPRPPLPRERIDQAAALVKVFFANG